VNKSKPLERLFFKRRFLKICLFVRLYTALSVSGYAAVKNPSEIFPHSQVLSVVYELGNCISLFVRDIYWLSRHKKGFWNEIEKELYILSASICGHSNVKHSKSSNEIFRLENIHSSCTVQKILFRISILPKMVFPKVCYKSGWFFSMQTRGAVSEGNYRGKMNKNVRITDLKAGT
jgi:hypothetical protein